MSKEVESSREPEIPIYRCQEVGALKIRSIDDPNLAVDGSRLLSFVEKDAKSIAVDGNFMRRCRPEAGGYYIVHQDGHASFLPAMAFEEIFTK